METSGEHEVQPARSSSPLGVADMARAAWLRKSSATGHLALHRSMRNRGAGHETLQNMPATEQLLQDRLAQSQDQRLQARYFTNMACTAGRASTISKHCRPSSIGVRCQALCFSTADSVLQRIPIWCDSFSAA